MWVTTSQIRDSEIAATVTRDANGALLRKNDPQTISISPEGMINGRIYMLKMSGRLIEKVNPTAPAMLRYRGKTATITPDIILAVTASDNYSFELINVKSYYLKTIQLDIEVPETQPSERTPIAVELEVTLGSPELPRWNTSRWNTFSWNRAKQAPSCLVWNRSRWDDGRWYSLDNNHGMSEITGAVTEIQISRGVAREGAVLSAQLGTATINLYNPPDPRMLGIAPGKKIKITNYISRKPLFTGKLTNISIDPLKEPKNPIRVQLQAADTIAELAQIKRYGCTEAETETAEDRVRRLLEKRINLPWKIITPAQPNPTLLRRTVLEASLLTHLDLWANTMVGAWWIDQNGAICLCPGTPPETGLYEISDTANPSYVEADGGWNTENLITAIKATNLGAKPGDQSPWVEDNQTYYSEDPTGFSKIYGVRISEIEINAAAGSDQIVKRLVADSATPITLQTATINTQTPKTAPLADLDLMQTIITHLRGETEKSLITHITHHITPLSWLTKLTFTKRKEN